MENPPFAGIPSVVNYLKEWYRKYGRHELWWRRVQLNPYEVFVIETFLWKTRAEIVAEIARKFLEEFPDINTLANASQERLEEIFSNLGLQRRKSSLMIRAAKYIIEKYNGEFPTTYEDLIKIPGVGQYLANAILCFAYNQPVIPVDANVKRVVEKFFNLKIKNLRKLDEKTKNILREIGTTWGNFKEAAWCLIDYGSYLARAEKIFQKSGEPREPVPE
jgi:A/G-specific adenine glycosylase